MLSQQQLLPALDQRTQQSQTNLRRLYSNAEDLPYGAKSNAKSVKHAHMQTRAAACPGPAAHVNTHQSSKLSITASLRQK